VDRGGFQQASGVIGEKPRTNVEISNSRFSLTKAIELANANSVRLEEGLKLFHYPNCNNESGVPMIITAISAEKIFDCFCDLISSAQKECNLNSEVHLILETSHSPKSDPHTDIWIERADLTLFLAKFREHKELFLHDGCTGVAIAFPEGPFEIQMDDHKLIYIHSPKQDWALRLLKNYGVDHNPNLNLVTQVDHLHNTEENFELQFFSLCRELGREVYYDEF
jgi:hypothetical protein